MRSVKIYCINVTLSIEFIDFTLAFGIEVNCTKFCKV